MEFKDQLLQVMERLKINQIQLAGLTGKCRASISQYISGKQIPTEEGKREIALALGLEADYFTKNEDPLIVFLKSGKGKIPRLLPKEAAKMMSMSVDSVTKGLQQRVFDWGYAIQKPSGSWVYFINARRFAEIERINVE